MKYKGENFAGTLICILIKEKCNEVTTSDIQEAARIFLEEELRADPKAKLIVTESDIKKACRKKSMVVKYDKKEKKAVFLSNDVDAYYHLHWAYEAMSLRCYGDDFSDKVLAAFKKI